MIYKPAPWKSYNFGAYYLKQTKIAKLVPNFKEAHDLLRRNDISNMCHILDIMSSTKWRVNKKVLNVIEFVWNMGGNIASIPKRYNERPITPDMLKNAKLKERMMILKEHQQNMEAHSLRCEFLLRLDIAQSFKDVSTLYFPQNLDFRGRVYPIPPHLNHMGADLARGILEFSEGKELGDDGIRWLKINLANHIGKDKLPLNERVAYVDSILDEVHKCANDPYNHVFWLESEEPWQALSVMFELSQALKSKDPTKYVSYVPVHVDGSCNGMQHYAALGLDSLGAKQVSLDKTEKPGDVYTAILELVKKEIENDKDPKNEEIIKALKGNIERKTIKQTVMTSVYGVTYIGARKQIQKQLAYKKLFDSNGALFRASGYLAKTTIKCIGDMFSDANKIKDWFAKCAKQVAHTGDPVKWITPLGLPCVQPYKRTTKADIITTILQDLSVISSLDEQAVNKNKNTTAFPPNYVHSLDSTHMMYTAMECFDKDITFASVHDSFWTHASTTTEMSKILREKFIKLHGEESQLLETLEANFKQRYPHSKFPTIPEKGDFDLTRVRESDYFFA